MERYNAIVNNKLRKHCKKWNEPLPENVQNGADFELNYNDNM